MINSSNDEKNELILLAKENLEYTKLIYKDTQKIKKYMFWRMIVNIVLITLTVAPIIVALIWLPPLLGDVFSSYSSVLGDGAKSMDGISNILNDLK